jgi:hypothetical protein
MKDKYSKKTVDKLKEYIKLKDDTKRDDKKAKSNTDKPRAN